MEKEFNLGLEQNIEQREKLFKLYKSYETVGTEIKNVWLKSSDAIKRSKEQFFFNLSADNTKEGLINQTYGLFLLSLLMDRYKVEFTESEKEKYRQTLVWVMDYIEENGIDASPYATPDINKEIFGGNRGAFVESLTWSLSSILFARRLHINGKLKLDAEMERIARLIARLLHLLLENVIHRDGSLGYDPERTDYVGWGPITGCIERSLYFTHSVCETFGDVEDTILGNPELGITRDDAFIAQLASEYKYDVVGRFKSVCEMVGANVYEDFKDQIGKEFFYADGTKAEFKQIAYSLQSPVLLNQLYVVLTAIFTNYHQRFKQDTDEWKVFSTNIKNAVDIVYKAYRDLQDLGKENLVDREYVTFSEAHSNPDYYKKYHAKLAGEKINVSVLEALIIRTKCMIVTYVTKYPEREIGEILNIMLSNRLTDRLGQPVWLWNSLGYNLQQTERAITSIREFYDYYETYEREYAEKNADIEELKREYAKKLEDERNDFRMNLEEATRKYREALEALEQQQEEKLNATISSYKVEQAVREVVREAIRPQLSLALKDVLHKIAESNRENRAGSDHTALLNAEEKELRIALVDALQSFFVPIAQEVNLSNLDDAKADKQAKDWSADKIVALLFADMKKFVMIWAEALCRYNEPQDSYRPDEVKRGLTESVDLA